jgi:glycosyltransferase involved in cell wall biosynthesis
VKPSDEAPLISAIVCTHNGGRRLSAVVETLLGLSSPSVFEVVVVDNASTDGAPLGLGASRSPRLRVIQEPRIGLSTARATGVENAEAPIIVFVDDDNYLTEGYFHRAASVMESHPTAAAAGGHAIASAAGSLPKWFPQFEHYYGCGPQAVRPGLMPTGSFLRGAGLVVRRTAWFELIRQGGLQKLMDRSGTRLSTGGDAELSLAWQIMGYDLVYDDQLILRHEMTPDRLTIGYLTRLAYNNGKASAILDSYVARLTSWTPSRWLRAVLHELRPSADIGRAPIAWSCGIAWRLGRIRQIGALRRSYGNQSSVPSMRSHGLDA